MENNQTENLLVELAEWNRTRHFGKYRGLVRDVDDPDNMGRITALVPEIYGDQEISPWALPAVPFAGNSHGLVVLPEYGDGVWIEFEGGDISRPIWSGSWWAQNELPSPGAARVLALVTTCGHKLVLDDAEDKIQLRHACGAELTMTERSILLKIGPTQIELSASGVSINNGALEVR